MEMNTQRMDAFMKDVTDCRKAIDLCSEAIKKLEGQPMRLLISDGWGENISLNSGEIGLSKESQAAIVMVAKGALEAREIELCSQMDKLMGNYDRTIGLEAVPPAFPPRPKRRQSSGPINPDDVEW